MKRPISLISLFILAIACVLSTGMANAQGNYTMPKKKQPSNGNNVVKVVNSHKNISVFAGLLKKSGFTNVLQNGGPYTVLAPDNKAMKKAGDASKMKKNSTKAQQMVGQQLLKGQVPKNKVESALNVKVKKKYKASNGVVYVVDSMVKTRQQPQQQ